MDVLFSSVKLFYRMANIFYPFELTELRSWRCSSPDIKMQNYRAAEWLRAHRSELSSEALSILDVAREIYKRFYAELASLDLKRWKITDWDAGWYQIRMSLGATIDLSTLSEKLLPQIYQLGFLRDEVKEF